MAVLVKTNVGGGGGVGIEQIIKENGLSDLSIIDKNKGYVSEEKTVDLESLPATFIPSEGVNGFKSLTINKPDELIPENIVSGKTILGVEGDGGLFYPSVFATGVSQNDNVKLFKVQKNVMEDLIPHLTADTSECLVYNLTISSDHPKYHAFDGDDSTCAYGLGSSYPRGYGYDLSEVKYIDSIKMYAHTFSGGAVTFSMAIQVSDDGTTWKDVKTWSEAVSGNAYFARQDVHVGVYARYVRVVQTSLSISNSGTFMLHDLRVIGNTDPFETIKEITNKKWVVKDTLPSEYQEVEYIESNGTQYIDTGINMVMGDTIMFDVDIQGTNAITEQCLGLTAERGMYAEVVGSGIYWCMAETSGSYPVNTTMKYTDRNAFKLTFATNSSNGVTETIEYDSTVSREHSNRTAYNKSIKFLGVYNSDSELAKYGMSAKTYKFDLYKNGVMVRNYIPCYRKSDNAIGMYDTVSNTFYTNSGTGTFLKGADVLKNGYVFKLNELGMYRLSADNGSMTKTYDVLVDYPLEYVVPVRYALFLYNYGEQHTELTGGWSKGVHTAWDGLATVTMNTDHVYFQTSGVSSDECPVATVNKVDITDYSVVKAHFTELICGTSYALNPSVVVTVADRRGFNPTNSTTGKQSQIQGVTGERILELDVSDLSGTYYVICGIGSDGDKSGSDTGKLVEVWLE